MMSVLLLLTLFGKYSTHISKHTNCNLTIYLTGFIMIIKISLQLNKQHHWKYRVGVDMKSRFCSMANNWPFKLHNLLLQPKVHSIRMPWDGISMDLSMMVGSFSFVLAFGFFFHGLPASSCALAVCIFPLIHIAWTFCSHNIVLHSWLYTGLQRVLFLSYFHVLT